MATPALAQTNIKWREVTVKIDDDTSMRIQYLSDHRITNYGQLADLVAKGYDFGRVWVERGGRERAYAEASRSAIDLLHGSSESEVLATKDMVRHATQAELRKFEQESGRKAAESVAAAGRAVGEAIVETAERAAAILPVPTGQVERERRALARRLRQRPGEVVSETARGESAEAESAVSTVEVEKAEEAAEQEPALSTKETIVIDSYVSLPTGKIYNFQISYNPRVAGLWDGTMNFFVKHPECVYSFRWQQRGKEEWHNFRGGQRGKNFTNEYIELFTRPLTIRFLNEEGRISVRMNLYLDLDSPRRAEIESMIAGSKDLPETIRELVEKGYLRLYSEGERGARIAGDRLASRIEDLLRGGFRPAMEYNF